VNPRTVLLQLYVAYQLAGGLIEHELAELGIADEYPLYTALKHHARMTPTQLAQHLGLPLSTALFRIGKLVERGHAERVPNPRDRRSTLVALTAEGDRLVEAAHPRFGAVLERLEAHLERPLDEVHASVEALRSALDAALAEARDEELLRRRAA